MHGSLPRLLFAIYVFSWHSCCKCYQNTHEGRVDILFGPPRHNLEAQRINIVADALVQMLPPEAWVSMLQRGVWRRANRLPCSLGFVVPGRPRSRLTRKPRLLDIQQLSFLHTDIFPRELRGNALQAIKRPSPHLYKLPRRIPTDGSEIVVWGRRWLVRESHLLPGIGLGLFACEDILVPPHCDPIDYPELFPYAGPRYSRGSWLTLSRQCPTYTYYGMKIDLVPAFWMMDGYPPRTGNLAGYINSSFGVGFPNAEWVEVTGRHRRMCHSVRHYIMTFATRTIHAGDEVLVSYDPRRNRFV